MEKEGYNIRLAGKLTGYKSMFFHDGESDNEDVDLEEFADEIDGLILDELKAIADTKICLGITVEDLVQRTDLEKQFKKL